jgi:hypothetical protein
MGNPISRNPPPHHIAITSADDIKNGRDLISAIFLIRNSLQFSGEFGPYHLHLSSDLNRILDSDAGGMTIRQRIMLIDGIEELHIIGGQ